MIYIYIYDIYIYMIYIYIWYIYIYIWYIYIWYIYMIYIYMIYIYIWYIYIYMIYIYIYIYIYRWWRWWQWRRQLLQHVKLVDWTEEIYPLVTPSPGIVNAFRCQRISCLVVEPYLPLVGNIPLDTMSIWLIIWWLWNIRLMMVLLIIWLLVEPYPSEKWWSESRLGWCHSQLNGKIKFMFQTTNQTRVCWMFC